jgi:hypothetical protein
MTPAARVSGFFHRIHDSPSGRTRRDAASFRDEAAFATTPRCQRHPHAQRSSIPGGAIGHGPWWVPLGARTLAGSVKVQSFRGGVELSADFDAGPYRYTQLWRFHDDGRMCPWLTIAGAGVHDQHTYHPHWRFDFDVDGARADALERFEDGRWQRVDEEGWFPATGEADDAGNVWRQVDFGSGCAVNLRPHTWDDAEVFAIRYHDGEWPPFSPRSAAGAQPFPAAYVGREPLDDQDVTLWYVAHVHYDQAFPYTAGPWIKLAGFDKK